MATILSIAETLEKFVEKASRPGVLGLPGRKIEKKTRTELGQYFDRIGAEVLALNLQDRVMHNAEAARHVVAMALHNVLRKNRQLLLDTLQSNMEKAYLTALKLDYVKESVEDEPRDDHGRWTATGALTEKKYKTEDVFKSKKSEYPKGVWEKLFTHGEDSLTKPVEKELPISKLVPTQSHIVTAKMAKYAKGSTKAVEVLEYKGKTYLMDGHHRAAAAIRRGEKTIKASVFKLNTKFKEADDFFLTPPETTITDTTSTLTQNAAAWAEQNAGELVTGIDATTADLISSTVADGIENQLGVGGIGRAIKDIMDSMSTYRAESIASTEINRAMSAAAFEKMDLLGIEYKQIVLSDDACPICEENAAADPLPIDEDYPSGDSGSPFHPNCRCAMTGARAPEIEEAYNEDEPRDDKGMWTSGSSFTTNEGRKTKMGVVRNGGVIDAKDFHSSVLNKNEGIVPVAFDPANDALHFPNAGRYDADHGNFVSQVIAGDPDTQSVRGLLDLKDGSITWYDLSSEHETIASNSGALPERIKNTLDRNLNKAKRSTFYEKKANGRTVKIKMDSEDIRKILG